MFSVYNPHLRVQISGTDVKKGEGEEILTKPEAVYIINNLKE